MSECPLELSFSLCDEIVCSKNKNEEQQPPQVIGPPEKCEPLEFKAENQEAFEKAEEEKSEKEENMEVTCSVSIDGQEKQEFSFTLYEFDAHEKINKQDVERVVVRSICEALGKTLKLPPSGSRTIKVKLAISPDSSKECDGKDAENDVKWPTPSPEESASPMKAPDYGSVQSANTTSTYLQSSTDEKNPSNYTKYCTNHSLLNSPSVMKIPSPDGKAVYSPKLRSSRQGRSISFQRPEMKNYALEHEKRSENENLVDNRNHDVDGHDTPVDPPVYNKHQANRDHIPDCRDRRIHYGDAGGLESNVRCDSEPPHGTAFPPHADGNYVCSQRILDRTHVCASKSHRTREALNSPMKKPPLPNHTKVSSGSVETAHAQKTRVNPEPQDDLLNLNFDLCDLVPDVKFDWEKVHHRRSKSFDVYENEYHNGAGFYSPRPKHRLGQDTAMLVENHKTAAAPVTSSPSHHHRYRHREREKQRAMQQVANWIEHSSTKQPDTKHFLGNTVSQFSQNTVVQRHEHHHLHEHVHHHYHHFVEF